MSSVTTIPARSPFLQYTPCIDCVADGGWQAGENDKRGVDGRLSVGFNFTGTAFSYDFPSPPSEQWNSILTVNGSEKTATSGTPSYSVDRLPLGLHSVQLVLVPPQPDPFSNRSISPFALSSITIDTGLSLSASSRNTTVDDTPWRNGTVILSPGWNMMESDDNGAESNYINEEQIQAERWTRTRHFNGTLSWTEQRRANTTMLFEGEQVWVYGLSGGEAGGYEVLVDGVTRGRYNASGGERVYQSLLFTSNLPSGRHNLTLSNLEEGKRLSFDRLVAAAGLTRADVPPSTPSTSPTAGAGPIDTAPHGLSPGAVGGIIVGVLVGLATLIPLILFVLRRRKKRYEDDLRIEKDDSVPETFFKWPDSSKYSTKKDIEGSWLRLPDRGLSPNPTTAESGGGANLGGWGSDAGFSLGSTTRDAAEEQTRTGLGTVGMGIFKLPTALRKSGSWSFGNGAQSERSFMSDLGSPSSTSHAHSHSHSLAHGGRFKNHEKARPESPASFFSFNPKGSKKPDFTISNPIPMTKTAGGAGAGADVAEDSMTPAMAAAVNGRVMSPLAQLKNHPFAGDSKLMPIGLGTSIGTGDFGQQQLEGTRVGRAF